MGGRTDFGPCWGCPEKEGLGALDYWLGKYEYESLEFRGINIVHGSSVSGTLGFVGGRVVRNKLANLQNGTSYEYFSAFEFVNTNW